MISALKELKEKRRMARKELKMKKLLEQFEKRDNILEDENATENDNQQLRNMILKHSQTLALNELSIQEERKRQSTFGGRKKSIIAPENDTMIEKSKQVEINKIKQRLL